MWQLPEISKTRHCGLLEDKFTPGVFKRLIKRNSLNQYKILKRRCDV